MGGKNPSGGALLALWLATPEGAKAYDTLATDSGIGQVLQNLAKIRASYLLVDTASYKDLASKIEPLLTSVDEAQLVARIVAARARWVFQSS